MGTCYKCIFIEVYKFLEYNKLFSKTNICHFELPLKTSDNFFHILSGRSAFPNFL